MADPLEFLWPIIDSPDPLVPYSVAGAWPPGVLDSLCGLDLLKPAARASHVVCPACSDGHVEEVIIRAGPGGRARYFIHCPEALRVRITPEMLRQWTVDSCRLSELLAAGLGLSGKVKELFPSRLWRLGRAKGADGLQDVLLARGLGWPDGRSVAKLIARTSRRIVLVAEHAPPDDVWFGQAPPVLSLALVARLSGDGFDFHERDLFAAATERRSRGSADRSEAETLTRLVRAHVKAEHKSSEMDDAYAQAVKTYGSSRKAEKALKDEGHDVDHSTIARAAGRTRDAQELVRGESSGSIIRRAPSQRRGRAGKKSVPPKSKDQQ